MSLEIGSVLADRYRIDGLLGEGGMGAVYRAWDIRLDQTVALKENLEDPTGRLKRSTDPTAKTLIAKSRERFETEAKVLARLRHLGLPRVQDHIVMPGEGQYLVMDYVEGQDLQVLLIQAGPLGEERVIEVGIEVCEILEYLHNQTPPIIHRDVKPANLRVTPQNKIILVDFGICKEGVGQVTRTAARAVSEGFSPPEMYHQRGQSDHRSDIYSLGATLLALLTGKEIPPPTERQLGALLPGLATQTRQMTNALQTVLNRVLELKPEHRYQSVSELKSALTVLQNARGPCAEGSGVLLGRDLTRQIDAIRDDTDFVTAGKVREKAPDEPASGFDLNSLKTFNGGYSNINNEFRDSSNQRVPKSSGKTYLIYCCPHCGKSIFLEWLGIGDKAKCKGCHQESTVPPTARSVDKKTWDALKESEVGDIPKIKSHAASGSETRTVDTSAERETKIIRPDGGES